MAPKLEAYLGWIQLPRAAAAACPATAAGRWSGLSLAGSASFWRGRGQDAGPGVVGTGKDRIRGLQGGWVEQIEVIIGFTTTTSS